MISKKICHNCKVKEGELYPIKIIDLDGFPVCGDCSSHIITTAILKRCKEQVETVGEAYKKEIKDLKLQIKQLKNG